MTAGVRACAALAGSLSAVLLALAACRASAAPGAAPVDAKPAGVELRAEVRGDHVACSTTRPDLATPYLVVETSGGATAYGVYGLGGPKNGLPVPRPLAGGAVTWPGVDHADALERLLERAGATRATAEDAVRLRRDTWFGPGLRVLFVPDDAVVEALGHEGCGVLAVELSAVGSATRWIRVDG